MTKDKEYQRELLDYLLIWVGLSPFDNDDACEDLEKREQAERNGKARADEREIKA